LATCVLRHPEDLRPVPPLGGRSFRGPWLMGARSLRWRPTLPWLAPLLALALLGQSAAPVPGRAAGITFTTAAGPLVGAAPPAPAMPRSTSPSPTAPPAPSRSSSASAAAPSRPRSPTPPPLDRAPWG